MPGVGGVRGAATSRTVGPLQSARGSPPLHPLLVLQGRPGNAAVSALVQRQLIVARDKEAEARADGNRLYAKSEEAYLAEDYAHAYDFLVATYEIKAYPQLKYDMAQCLRKLGGRREEAIRLYKEFLASGTGTPEHQKKATEYVAELTGPGPSGDAAKDATIGGVLYGKSEHAYLAGDYAHAYDFLRQTYDIKAYPQLKYDMAQCLRKLGGRREEAIRLYKEFLASGTGSPDHQRMARVYLRELVTQGASYS